MEGRPPFGLHDNAIALLHTVAASRVPPPAGDQVRVGIEYTIDKKERFQEVHLLGMLVEDGVPLINSDEVLSSQRVSDGEEEEDDQGDPRGRRRGNS